MTRKVFDMGREICKAAAGAMGTHPLDYTLPRKKLVCEVMGIKVFEDSGELAGVVELRDTKGDVCLGCIINVGEANG